MQEPQLGLNSLLTHFYYSLQSRWRPFHQLFWRSSQHQHRHSLTLLLSDAFQTLYLRPLSRKFFCVYTRLIFIVWLLNKAIGGRKGLYDNYLLYRKFNRSCDGGINEEQWTFQTRSHCRICDSPLHVFATIGTLNPQRKGPNKWNK